MWAPMTIKAGALTPHISGRKVDVSVYVWQISFDVQLQIQSGTWRFPKKEIL